MLTTTTPPPVIYQVITDEYHEHNAYSFHGYKLSETPKHLVYALDISACEMHKSYYDVVDEILLFNDKPSRRSSFYLEEDVFENQCILTVTKHPYNKNIYYNLDYDYWYPDYTYIEIKRHRKKSKKSRRSFNRFHSNPKISQKKVILFRSSKTKPKVVIKAHKPKPKIKKRKYKKKRHKRPRR